MLHAGSSPRESREQEGVSQGVCASLEEEGKSKGNHRLSEALGHKLRSQAHQEQRAS